MRNLFLLFTALCVSGCHLSKQPLSIASDFPTEYLLVPVDSINLEELGVLDSYNIIYKDSSLLFTIMRGEYKIGIYDMRNGSTYRFAKQGQGPGEVTMYRDIYTSGNNIHCFSDLNNGKIYQLNLDSLETGCREILSFNTDSVLFFQMAEIGEDFYLGTDGKGKGRFGVYNKQTKKTAYSQLFPENEAISTLSPFQKSALYCGTLIAIHPDSNKFATIFQGVMDIYSYDNERNIKHETARHYHYPDFFLPGEAGPGIGYKKDDLQYFTKIEADANYIYVLYTDRTSQQYMSDSFDCPYLLIYDWQGNPVQKFKLSRKLNTFSMNGNILYGMSRVYNPIIMVYALSDILIR